MLSDYEREVLTQIETELKRANSNRRSRVRGAARVARLLLAVAALVATSWLTAAAVLTPTAGALLAALCGVVVGWSLGSVKFRSWRWQR